MSATTKLGRVGLVLRGAYDAAAAYSRMDVVTYEGCAYAALKDTTGSVPTDAACWQPLADIRPALEEMDGVMESAKSAEQTRASGEAERQAAEQERAGSEAARLDAEQTRVDSENARQAAEQTRSGNEAVRLDAEQTRSGNEDARQTAEQTRIENEAERQTAESSRASAEEGRADAETERADAEQERVAAEQLRESAEAERRETFAGFEGEIGSLKADIGNIKETNREKWISKIEILPNKDILYNKLIDAEGTCIVLFPLSIGGVIYDFTDVCETLKRRLYVTDDYVARNFGVITDRIEVCNNSVTEIAGVIYTKHAFIFDTILSVEEIKAKVKIYALGLVEDKIKSNLYEKPEVQEQAENLITGKECILSGVKCSSSGKFVFSYDDSYTTVFCHVKAGDTVTSNCKLTNGTMFTIESNFKLSLPTAAIGESVTGSKYRTTTIKHDGYIIISFEKNKFALTNSTSTDIDDLWIATKNLDELYKNGGSKKRVTNDALQGLYDSAYILPEHTTHYYKDKKIAYIGDSTGAPNTSGGCGEYRKYVNKALGLEEAAWSSPVDIGYDNFSQGGSRMECEKDENQYDSDGVAKESNGRYSACGDARVNALPKDCDIICIFMGVNASNHAMEKDTDTSLWSLENSDVTTFIGAYNVCLSKIMYHYGLPAYYADIDYSNVNVVGDGTNVPQIIVMTPVHSGDTLSDKMDSYQDRLNGHIIWRRKALEYMTGLWGTPYLDTQRCMMANPFTVPLYYRYVNDTDGYDKIHFNLRGAKQVADGLIGLLRSVEPISENVTIV